MRPLDANDFRARRLVLEPDDFALGPDTDDPSPADLIDKETWESMVSLPDDVSVRTSNNYGKVLRVLWSYWDEWNCLTGALQLGAHSRPIARVAGDSSDELQASIFCSLIGYYRVAFSCLSNVIEQMTIGLELELSGDHSLFRDWVDGQKELKLGWAADLLPRSRAVSVLEIHLRSTVHDDLFGQESKDRRPAGFVRRLFSELSKFTHGYPGFTDSDMRESTGPIFVRETYERWLTSFRQVYATAVLEAQIAKPTTRGLAYGSKLTSRGLFDAVVGELSPAVDGRNLLTSLPAGLWP